MSITTTAEVLSTLAILCLDNDQLVRYDRLRLIAERAIKNYVKWDIEQATVTQFYDGNGALDIPLATPYVSAISAVYMDQQGAYGQNASGFAAATLLTAGADYALVYDSHVVPKGRSGLLRRLSGHSGAVFPSDLVLARIGGLSYSRAPSWPCGYGNIKVNCTFGWPASTMPADIKGIVAMAVNIFANSTKYGYPVQSEGLGDYNYSLAISRDAEFGSIRQQLSIYRDISI